MKTYLVRMSCEYSYQVEAENKEAAEAEAMKVHHEHWDKAWSSTEVEEVKPPQSEEGISP
jgi:hypothetical protein